MSEAELMEAVRALCTDLGLHVFHAADSRRSWGPGFPDLVIVGRGGCLFAEVKREDGSLSPLQREWQTALQGAGMRWRLWRPSDLLSGQIAKELTSLAAVQPELFAAAAP